MNSEWRHPATAPRCGKKFTALGRYDTTHEELGVYDVKYNTTFNCFNTSAGDVIVMQAWRPYKRKSPTKK